MCKRFKKEVALGFHFENISSTMPKPFAKKWFKLKLFVLLLSVSEKLFDYFLYL